MSVVGVGFDPEPLQRHLTDLSVRLFALLHRVSLYLGAHPRARAACVRFGRTSLPATITIASRYGYEHALNVDGLGDSVQACAFVVLYDELGLGHNSAAATPALTVKSAATGVPVAAATAATSATAATTVVRKGITTLQRHPSTSVHS